MVDVIWAVSLVGCALVILVMTLYFHQRNQAELAAEEEERQRKHATALAAAMGGSSGKQLHLSPEEIQRDLDRLCLLYSQPEPARKREATKPPPEAPKPPPAAKQPPTAPKEESKPRATAPKEEPKPRATAPKEEPKPPATAPKEEPKAAVKIAQESVEAPAHPTRLSRSERRARAEGPKGSDHIQSEIEQAVRDTH